MKKTEFDGARQYMFQDVEFRFYKDRPVMYKGKEQWEVTIWTDNPEQAEEWEREHLSVRGNNTTTKSATEWVVSLNRKVYKKDGTKQERVRIVDESLAQYSDDERRKIGNQSKGSVIVWQGKYNNEHGQGVSTSLTAMQIPRDKLKIFEGNMEMVDFENISQVQTSPGGEDKQLF